MNEYEFTKNWFGWGPQVWPDIIKFLPARKNFLEIGSFEGRSTVWIVENMMEDGGEITCIDTWSGGEEHINNEMEGAELRFDKNRELAQTKFPLRHINKWKGRSTEELATLLSNRKQYDFIYIDGSHRAKDVLTDACMAWPLLKMDGLLAFDDYLWKPPGFSLTQRPKLAIDAFVNVFEDEIAVAHNGYQLIVRKIK